jgi:hypothetical protein
MTKLLRAIWRRAVAWYAFVRYGAYMSEETEPADTSPCLVAPPRSIEMVNRGTVWGRTVDGGWREVCDTCGGNCGQCGMTERLGNMPVDLGRLVRKTGMNRPVAGLPRL